MKTLIIVSHPDIEDSNSQQFLKEAIPRSDHIKYHHLESVYPTGNIDIRYEQDLLKQYDRIIFQFPFYWYAAPPMLKKWQDEVLEEYIAFGTGGTLLQGKELGLVMTIGIAEKEYQVGGAEQFTISQLTIPFQALANKTGMHFLKPFTIFQFYYLSEKEQQDLLIKYQQYLMLDNTDSLSSRVQWLVEQLESLKDDSTLIEDTFTIDHIIDVLEDNQLELDEMKLYLDK